MDPDLSKDYLDRIQSRTKERKYHFDYAFGPECTNSVCSVRVLLLCHHEAYPFLCSGPVQPIMLHCYCNLVGENCEMIHN